ncbi:MAG: hypothetical protein ABI402_14055 [Ferruginibacter sp.]
MKHLVFIAVFFFIHSIAFSQTTNERLEINWPVRDRWKLLADNKDTTSHILEYAPPNATATVWDTIIYVQTIKDIVTPNLDLILKSYTKGALKESPKAKFTVLERDDSTKNFWVIFKVETTDFPDDPIPESQLWYIIQGDNTFFVNFIAVKEKILSDNFVAYWSKVFKESKLIKEIK